MKSNSAWFRDCIVKSDKTYATTARGDLIEVEGVYKTAHDLAKAFVFCPPGSQYYDPHPPKYKIVSRPGFE